MRTVVRLTLGIVSCARPPLAVLSATRSASVSPAFITTCRTRGTGSLRHENCAEASYFFGD